MATKLYFRTAGTSDYGTGNNDANLRGTAIVWANCLLSTTAGASLAAATQNAIAGLTPGLEVGSSSVQPRVWYSLPLDADVTISGSITWNLWAAESAMTDNVAINGILQVIDGATGTMTLIDQTARVTELQVGPTRVLENFAETPAVGVACKRGDRLRVRIFGDDAGTMAAGGAFTVGTNGATPGADGDSWLQLTENLTFVSEPAGTTIYPTDTASAVSTASVDREAWTSRGGGVQTDVRNTAAGFTAPLQFTDTAGGTVVDWFTRPLTAFTLGGAVRVNGRLAQSVAGSSVTLRCEIARVEGDGTSPTVWGATTNGTSASAAPETVNSFLVGGDDLAISDGQRLRIRFYIDDASLLAMVTGRTATLYYAGTSGGASGDTYLTFTQTLTEFSAGTSVNATLATATGAALGATTTIQTNAGAGAGTGAALNASVTQGKSVTADVATGTGAALGATTTVQTNAGVATGTGSALNAAPSLAVNAGLATGTGTALNATVTTATATNVNATPAAATGLANGVSASVAATAGVATGTAAALGLSASVQGSLSTATGTAVALNATVTTQWAAGLATGTGVALNPSAQTSSSTSVDAGLATATGSALDATAQTTSATNVNATPATASGTALNASAAIAVNAGLATATATALGVSPTTQWAAGLATGTGTALGATATIAQSVIAGLATASGTANAPAANVGATATQAAATGTALDASAEEGNVVFGQATPASGSGTAHGISTNDPVWTTPADTVLMTDTPELKFLMPDMNGPAHFWLELDTVSTFDSGSLRTIRSDLAQTGWDFWNGSGWVAVDPAGVPEAYAGNEARYTVQTPLTSTVWYRRVRAGA